MLKKITLIFGILFAAQASYAKTIEDFEHETPRDPGIIQFVDEDKTIHSLDQYRGSVMVLNFWATWCVPCVKEMPDLDKLSVKTNKNNIKIVPVSVDFKGLEVVNEFYKANNIENLPAFLDEKGKAFKNLKLRALPTTLIIDKKGMEVARVLGDISWNREEVEVYLNNLAK